MSTQRERLIQRIERQLCWSTVPASYRDESRRLAIRVVDDLFKASAEGKAVERALRMIEARENVA